MDYTLDFLLTTFHQKIDEFYLHYSPVVSESLEVVAPLEPLLVELDSESESVQPLELAMHLPPDFLQHEEAYNSAVVGGMKLAALASLAAAIQSLLAKYSQTLLIQIDSEEEGDREGLDFEARLAPCSLNLLYCCEPEGMVNVSRIP